MFAAMTKKGRELLNKPVIDINSGVRLGYIRDFELEDEKKIAGIYADEGQSWEYYIPLEFISSMGRDAVLVNGWERLPPGRTKGHRKNRYTGAQVMTSLGQNIGTVEDILIEENEGSIKGYEISDGLFKDMVMGRKTITAGDILTYGEESIIVADSNLEQGDNME